MKNGADTWEAHFDKLSIKERSKFDEETLSNSNGVKQKKTYSMKTDGSRNEYIVVCFTENSSIFLVILYLVLSMVCHMLVP